MKATVVDLRYKMKGILQALDRNEQVVIMYHGKEKGIIIPASISQNVKIAEHPFFGMNKDKKNLSVEEELSNLRSTRY